ncbi:unnamed protein product [Diatraea saccharalis]|uniref:Uncharacterized protein n=1 Tax=Diatraea saccharalis TaxID=40085 RepID=A0A9N9QZV8_9NEOP|nr:unnamed protein product [Diatraea saccharalis]
MQFDSFVSAGKGARAADHSATEYRWRFPAARLRPRRNIHSVRKKRAGAGGAGYPEMAAQVLRCHVTKHTYRDLILDTGDVEERLDLLPQLPPGPGAELQLLVFLAGQVTTDVSLEPRHDLGQPVITQLLHLTQDTSAEEDLLAQVMCSGTEFCICVEEYTKNDNIVYNVCVGKVKGKGKGNTNRSLRIKTLRVSSLRVPIVKSNHQSYMVL